MENEYMCPLLGADIDETICYDIQMVTGAGNLISKRILEDYDSIVDTSKITDERAGAVCPACPFNQLRQPAQTTAV